MSDPVVEEEVDMLVYDDTISTSSVQRVLFVSSDASSLETYANASTFTIVYGSSSSLEDIWDVMRRKFSGESIVSRIGFAFHNRGDLTEFCNRETWFSDSDVEEEGQTVFSRNAQFMFDLLREFKQVTHVDFLACKTLQSEKWRKYFSLIQAQTGVVVGASEDDTGNVKYGGDWILESTMEDIREVYFTGGIENYASLLDSPYTNVKALDGGSCLCLMGTDLYVAQGKLLKKLNMLTNELVDVAYNTGTIINPDGGLQVNVENITGLAQLNGPQLLIVMSSTVFYYHTTSLSKIKYPRGITENYYQCKSVGIYSYITVNVVSGKVLKINDNNGVVSDFITTGLRYPQDLAIYGNFMYIRNTDATNQFYTTMHRLSDGALVSSFFNKTTLNRCILGFDSTLYVSDASSVTLPIKTYDLSGNRREQGYFSRDFSSTTNMRIYDMILYKNKIYCTTDTHIISFDIPIRPYTPLIELSFVASRAYYGSPSRDCTAKLTALELKNTGGFYPVSLRSAKYTAYDLKTAGYTNTEIKAAGFNIDIVASVGTNNQSLTILGDYLYTFGGTKIVKIDLRTNTFQSDFSYNVGVNTVRAMCAFDSYLYFDTGANSIGRLNISNGSGVITNYITGISNPYGIVTDGTYLYISSSIAAGKIYRVLLSYSGAVTSTHDFITSGLASPWHLCIYGSHLYVRESNNTLKYNVSNGSPVTFTQSDAVVGNSIWAHSSGLYVGRVLTTNISHGITQTNFDGSVINTSFFSNAELYSSDPDGGLPMYPTSYYTNVADIAIYNNRLYCASNEYGYIFSVDLPPVIVPVVSVRPTATLSITYPELFASVILSGTALTAVGGTDVSGSFRINPAIANTVYNAGTYTDVSAIFYPYPSNTTNFSTVATTVPSITVLPNSSLIYVYVRPTSATVVFPKKLGASAVTGGSCIDLIAYTTLAGTFTVHPDLSNSISVRGGTYQDVSAIFTPSSTNYTSVATTIPTLTVTEYTLSQLKTLSGMSVIELKAGYSVTELKTAGYTALELKTGGFTDAELKAAGFTMNIVANVGKYNQSLSILGDYLYTFGSAKVIKIDLRTNIILSDFSYNVTGGHQVKSMCAYGDYLYYHSGATSVGRLNISNGSGVITNYITGITNPWGIVTNGTNLYISSSQTTGNIYRVPLNFSGAIVPATQTFTTTSLKDPSHLCIYGSHLYVRDVSSTTPFPPRTMKFNISDGLPVSFTQNSTVVGQSIWARSSNLYVGSIISTDVSHGIIKTSIDGSVINMSFFLNKERSTDSSYYTNVADIAVYNNKLYCASYDYGYVFSIDLPPDTPLITEKPTAIASITYPAAIGTVQLTGGKALSDIGGTDISGTFIIRTDISNNILNANTYTDISATFLPYDNQYVSASTFVQSVTINKGTPFISNIPTATIVYPNKLRDTTFSGGQCREISGGTILAGAFTIHPDLSNSVFPAVGTYDVSAVFTPTSSVNYGTAVTIVPLTVTIGTPVITVQPDATVVYPNRLDTAIFSGGATLDMSGGSALLGGTYSIHPDFSNSVIAFNGSYSDISAVYNPPNLTNFKTVTTKLRSLTVFQGTPFISARPTATVTYPNKLGSVVFTGGACLDRDGGSLDISGTFTIHPDLSNSLFPVDNYQDVSAIFTPSASFANYGPVSTTIQTLTVAKGTPFVSSTPTATLVYPNTLGSATIINGSCVQISGSSTSVAGIFTVHPDLINSVRNADTYTDVSAVFTPSFPDSSNFNPVSTTIRTLTVSKGTPFISVRPTATALFPKKLSTATITGGVALDKSGGSSLVGTFSIHPDLSNSVKVVGQYTDISAIFTPMTSANFHPVTATTIQTLTVTEMDISLLKNLDLSANYLRSIGYSAPRLQTAGYTAAELKTGGYSNSEIKTANYNASALKEASYNATTLKNEGYTADELKTAYNASELKTGGFSAEQLKDADFTAKQLREANYTLAVLKDAEYSVTDLSAANYLATELLGAGFALTDLKTAGYEGQLKAAGKTPSDLVNAGFAVDKLYTVFSANIDETKSVTKAFVSNLLPATTGKTNVTLSQLRGYDFTPSVVSAVAVKVTDPEIPVIVERDELSNGSAAVYAILDVLDCYMILPTWSSSVQVMNAGNDTYEIYDSDGTTILHENLVSGDTITEDGLTIVIGSVTATLAPIVSVSNTPVRHPFFINSYTNGGGFSMNRSIYTKTLQTFTDKEGTANKQFYGKKNRDASSVIHRRKMLNLGRTPNTTTTNTIEKVETNDVRQAKQRVRNSGYVVPQTTNNMPG